ncbi:MULTISPECIES: hypothetical protein [unclassified Campylobacter]|uniref:hypothetical protein n=1 Tax=unclassified Campylobacter TaxID=2593542 RepID=UPI0022E9AAA0|nr:MULTISPECIES: hypothetical protein [unclassified Campylobacter]MDA3043727.1 hypothetical protein [Campylobacter sp. JMF_09 ED2]MDA3045322.1 hypothetical protein [Campylobacter sp. JMF_07 ED4]MDA3064508.1 hypothetical protein [Campylobacter sp. JMF_11 EL3]MDA3072201.1 hypothetical protein [Campylobacter sp. VBCF_03 NA9]MDA3075594.1 hypothetical protein [Campylobacter sp. JMF_05 ED3]
MRKLLLILLANFALGANLLQYEIFNNDDSVDIVLSFDSSYEPDITRTIDGQSMSLVLKNLGSEEKYNEMRTNQKVLRGFTIAPKGNNVEINFPTGANLIANAISQDAKLKLSINIKNPNFDQSQMSVSPSQSETEQEKPSSNSGLGWILPGIVILLLIGAVMVLVRKFKGFKGRKSIDDTWEQFNSSVLERQSSDESEDTGAQGGERSYEARANFDDEISDEVAQNISFTQESEKSWQELAQSDEIEEAVAEEYEPRGDKFDDEMQDKIEEEFEEVPQNSASQNTAPKNTAPQSSFSSELKERLEAKSDKISAFESVLRNEIKENAEASVSDIGVEFVKEIDESSTAVVLKFAGKKHLVVLKNSNIIE